MKENIQESYYQKNKEKIKKWSKEYYRKNKDKWKNYPKKSPEYIKNQNKQTYNRNKDKFLLLYGNKCNCCGETIKEFLTIDHINGRGKNKNETSYKAYSLAIKFLDQNKYQILCYNCNCAKGKYGTCPHKNKLY